ncbi:hypothetical protein D9611_006629 [Ephemerocybe angulata]|uniref:Uncharacterized protein n=1 Tax=Ephemerocybe angulata TaxID=980116 RepID=A0A8H5C828_9AGAR|nr:hypothetical protein D9611_006629 [Tulosesus angulatus]
MAYTLHAGSTPFTTPGHHSTPSAAGSSPFNSGSTGHTPLQPRTPNVPQDPFSAPSTSQRPDPFNFSPFHSNAKPASLQINAEATPAPAATKKGYRFTAYTGRENSTNVAAHRPLNSSPLAQGTPVRRQHNYNNNNMDDMEDEEDDDAFSAHQPSSPLSRVAPWSSSTATGPSSAGTSSHSHSSHSGFGFTVGSSSTSASSTRRSIMKTPGRDDEDEEEVEDDAVNPSPLFHRRRAQYKSTAPSLSAATRRRISSGSTSRSPAMPRYASPTSSPPIAALFENPRATAAAGEDENPRKAFLRERFKKTYFARATKAREEAVRKRRRRVEGLEGRVGESDEEMEEEGDEAILNDVLFARIMASLNKKQERAYRISYAREVGSSFDPDLEDVSRWEQELSGAPLPPTSFSNHAPSPHRPSPYQSTSTGFPTNGGGGSSPPRPPTEYEYGYDGYGYDGDEGEEDFVGLEEAEIEAYAEEYARAVEGREAEAASASSSGTGTGAHSSGTGVHSSTSTGVQQGQGQDVGNLLEGLEDLPEEELFGVWNWDEGDEMDLS